MSPNGFFSAERRTRRRNMLREFSVPLMAGVVTALVWANLDPDGYREAIYEPLFRWHSLDFWVNEIFMVFFFGIAAVEITDSFLPGGSLNPPTKAVNPLLATLGGVVGPVVVFLLLNGVVGSPELRNGWGIGTATDIALAWLVARLVFGKNHPAVSFLLLLAVADDAIGLIIIAVFYPDPQHPVSVLPLLLVLAGILVAYILRRRNVASYWPYVLLAGACCWVGMYKAHLHPALALVMVVPFMPHKIKREGEEAFEDRKDEDSPLARFEHEWKVIVDFGMFMFGLANAGVQFSVMGTVTWMVLTALVVGKTCGIFLMASVGKLIGFPLPKGVGHKQLLVVGLIGGMGLTVALFIAGVAFTDVDLQGAAKMGALFSAGVAVPAILLGKFFRVKSAAGAEAETTMK